MASSYSALKIELIATGEQVNVWGSTTNTNLGTALEEAIVGRTVASFTTDGNLTIDLTNTNTTQVARHYILSLTSTGALTATRDLIVPSIDKPYIIENNTTGAQSIRVKTTAGTGITVPNGKTAMVYANSTNVVSAVSYIPALSIDTATLATAAIATAAIATAAIAAGTATFSAATITTATINGGTITGITDLAVADGGTGLSTLTANNVILGNGASAPTFVAPGTSGNLLTSNGTTWASTAPAAPTPDFASGTRIGFQQTAAPTGWTKDTTAAINDSILRLVTGSVTPSGGSVAFSTWNAQTVTGGTTLSTAQMPSHSHTYPANTTQSGSGTASLTGYTTNTNYSTSSTGSGGSHDHTLAQNIKYYDFIIASKN